MTHPDPPSLQMRDDGLFLLNDTPTDPPSLQRKSVGRSYSMRHSVLEVQLQDWKKTRTGPDQDQKKPEINGLVKTTTAVQSLVHQQFKK